MRDTDQMVLRDLAKKYREICAKDVQDERRDLWRKHNSLIKTRVPIILDWYCLSNTSPFLLQSECVCEDPFFRSHELWLRNMIFHDTVGDDHIFEPWITVRASLERPSTCNNAREGHWGDDAVWGLEYERIQSDKAGGMAWITIPPIRNREDVSKMVATPHVIDEEETARRVSRLQDAVGDILEVNVDRSPLYEYYGGNDLSTALGYLVGLEQMMIKMYDDPELLRSILVFMRDAVLAQYDEAETAGDWNLTRNFNMGMPYSQELPDPKANNHGAKMKDLWFFNCAQEFTLISPGMFEEFMLQYQMPIMERFGLVSYGCCENLTHFLPALRKVPNLRRIGITFAADLHECAEQIQQDYVIRWNPNPEMICCGFDPEHIRQIIREGFEALEGCIVDIYIKDISTVQGHPERLRDWVEIVRDVAEPF